MKTLMIIAVLLLIQTTPFAQAEDLGEALEADESLVVESDPIDPSKITPVDAKELKLLGRGLRVKDSNEGLAVACESNDCKKLRFVFFLDQNKAAFIGDAIDAPTAKDPRVLNKAYKLVVREFFDYHPTVEIGNKLNSIGAKAFFTLGPAAAAIVYVGATVGTGGFLTIGAAMGVIGVGAYLFGSDKVIDSIIGNDIVNVTMTNQAGWSWSENPKPIKPKAFALLLKQILHGHVRENRPGNSFDFVGKNAFEMDREYDLKKRKLMKKGAHFTNNYGRW